MRAALCRASDGRASAAAGVRCVATVNCRARWLDTVAYYDDVAWNCHVPVAVVDWTRLESAVTWMQM